MNARSKYHTQLAKLSFDQKTFLVHFFIFKNIIINDTLNLHPKIKTKPNI